jgi:hypothetical protein
MGEVFNKGNMCDGVLSIVAYATSVPIVSITADFLINRQSVYEHFPAN